MKADEIVVKALNDLIALLEYLNVLLEYIDLIEFRGVSAPYQQAFMS